MPQLKNYDWTNEELDVICATCTSRFGSHTGSSPDFICPGGKGIFQVKPPEAPPHPVATYGGGKCPYKMSCDSLEVGGYARVSDSPDREIFNICPKHIDEYLKAGWKTVVDLRPLSIEAREAKKEATSKEWLEDAYHSEYGHHGACAVCSTGWNGT